MKQTPEILSYSDPRSYLRAMLNSRSDEERGFGLRRLALKAGFRSPGTLSMILNNKRKLTQRAAEKLAKALGLNGRRRSYLLLLAELESAKSSEERFELQEKIFHIKSLAEENPISLKQYRTLAIWYYPAIYTLVGMPNFNRSPEWIAKKLGRNLTIQNVREAIGDLLNLGLLDIKQGRLVQSRGALTTEEGVRSVAIGRYHKQMLQLAQESLQLPIEKRELNGLTVPIAPHRMPEVRERIRQFRKDLNQYLSQFNEDGEIYQFNMQLFPLTQAIDGLEER